MIYLNVITNEFVKTHGINAELDGFLEIKSLRLYENEEEHVPTDFPDIIPEPPCLVMEVIDLELSTKEHKILKPIKWMKLTEDQLTFFKKYFEYKIRR